MKTNPITIDTILNAHPTKVWQAITNKNEMQNGYFDLAEFEPVAGFRFTFNGGSSPEKQYTHVCEIIHVESEKKLSYSW